MSFSQATITEVFPPVWTGGGFKISWSSSSPQGTWFQLYINRHLQWYGTDRFTVIQYTTGLFNFAVGTVGPGEQTTDFSSSLPADPLNRISIEWEGGTFLKPNIDHFNIYLSPTPNTPINFTTPIAQIAAYPGGILTDGFGLYLFGHGGFGESASLYTYTTGPLISGTWGIGVTAVDAIGNESTADTGFFTICVPPGEPALFSDNTRLHYTYNQSNHEVTLIWNASPG